MKWASKTLGFICLILLLSCSNSEVVIQPAKEVSSLPDYYLSQLSEKKELINGAIEASNANYTSFVFFTDAHWGDNQKHSPALIDFLIKNTPIYDVIFGGDVITSEYESPAEAIKLGRDFRASFDTLKCNMYYIYGNHDNNSNHYPDDLIRHIPDRQVYDYLQYGMGDSIYGGYLNFYFDRPSNKTRYICLDTGRYCYPQLRGNTIETIRFLVKSLMSTEKGWKIVVLSHMWGDLSPDIPREAFISDYIRPYFTLMDSFNLRKRGVFQYNDELLNYDFTDTASRIICCIGGHNHLDSIHYSAEGIPIINITTDSIQTVNDEPATIGTINEQSLTAFVIDYTNAVIKMYRIGRGKDREIPINNLI